MPFHVSGKAVVVCLRLLRYGLFAVLVKILRDDGRFAPYGRRKAFSPIRLASTMQPETDHHRCHVPSLFLDLIFN